MTVCMSNRTTWNVLIIDDDPFVVESTQLLLQDMGFQVSVCSSGNEALQLAEGQQFDFILADYEMPGMDGLKVSRHMRERFPRASIIGISGTDTCDDFLRAGANWFIHKPLTPDKLKQIFGNLRRC